MFRQVNHIHNRRLKPARAEKNLAPITVNIVHLPHRLSPCLAILPTIHHVGETAPSPTNPLPSVPRSLPLKAF